MSGKLHLVAASDIKRAEAFASARQYKEIYLATDVFPYPHSNEPLVDAFKRNQSVAKKLNGSAVSSIAVLVKGFTIIDNFNVHYCVNPNNDKAYYIDHPAFPGFCTFDCASFFVEDDQYQSPKGFHYARFVRMFNWGEGNKTDAYLINLDDASIVSYPKRVKRDNENH